MLLSIIKEAFQYGSFPAGGVVTHTAVLVVFCFFFNIYLVAAHGIFSCGMWDLVP